MNVDIINVGLSIYGTKELPGEADNPFILQMAADCGFKDYNHDSIAWCSLAANWIALKAGYERTGKLNARSWLNVGIPVDVPKIGDIVVISRGDVNGWEGHVGFYINKVDTIIYMLAGNQSDMLNIMSFDAGRLLGYRMLTKVTT